MSHPTEADAMLPMIDRPSLVPPSQVVRERLAIALQEADAMRRLLRVAERAEEQAALLKRNIAVTTATPRPAIRPEVLTRG